MAKIDLTHLNRCLSDPDLEPSLHLPYSRSQPSTEWCGGMDMSQLDLEILFAVADSINGGDQMRGKNYVRYRYSTNR